ncbi:hypothetical protein SPRG_17527 [Saprolegnia parasitica CBS 223.65]|uniref:Uncharacterized protein n=1 Tax=Saprolegnia parasitica (strain CBS 223.65) TaxID=695850 RepID=A0A067BF89_SAPPC|nr:hypothetical protein SPRG_17527 [Saprolegnia parasitica CBS 223.65]KDO17049.1 hypothetical protein SPRG_17527 [Saprolegnia parasitica CBS 223.65]|eukprot:XP_012212241.1 hypothetical protein SPRG_17527 [Saprolegnia parasitica CBS 223.65]
MELTAPTTTASRTLRLQILTDAIAPGYQGSPTVEWLQSCDTDFSPAAMPFVTEILTQLLNGHDCYTDATQTVLAWCMLVTDALPLFLASTSDQTQAICLQHLNEGDDLFYNALKALQQCALHFNAAIGKLKTLQRQLDADFDRDSAYHEKLVDQAVDKWKTCSHTGGAAIGALACIPLGLLGLVLVAPAALLAGEASEAVIRAAWRDELSNQLTMVSTKLKTLTAHVTSTKKAIDYALSVQRHEAEAITSLNANRLANMPLRSIRPEAETLVSMCNAYIEAHQGSTTTSDDP